MKQYFPTSSRSFANAFIDSLYAQRALEEGRRIATVNGLSALQSTIQFTTRCLQKG
jgi:hypothetical protein